MYKDEEKTTSIEDAKKVLEETYRGDIEAAQKDLQELLKKHGVNLNVVQQIINGQPQGINLVFQKAPQA